MSDVLHNVVSAVANVLHCVVTAAAELLLARPGSRCAVLALLRRPALRDVGLWHLGVAAPLLALAFTLAFALAFAEGFPHGERQGSVSRALGCKAQGFEGCLVGDGPQGTDVLRVCTLRKHELPRPWLAVLWHVELRPQPEDAGVDVRGRQICQPVDGGPGRRVGWNLKLMWSHKAA